MKQLKSASKNELVKMIEKHINIFDGIGTYFKGKARFGKLDCDEQEIRSACLRASKEAGRLARCENVDVCISDNLAVRIWDNLNEVALNIGKGPFRRAILTNRKRLEDAMKKADLSVPKSDHGTAK